MSEKTQIPKEVFNEYEELIKLNKRLVEVSGKIDMPKQTEGDESVSDYIHNLSILIQNLIEMKNILCSIELKKSDIERRLKEARKEESKQEIVV